MNDLCLLVIIAPPSLEDTLADWLIGQEIPIGFSSMVVNGHGEGHEGYTLTEQVRGSRRRIQFQIQAPQARAREMLEALRGEFGQAGLRYWMLPLLEGGRVGEL